MKRFATFLLVMTVALATIGCGDDSSGKPATEKDVKAFQGDPKSPALKDALQSHFGGGAAPPPPPAAATTGQ